MSKEVIELPLKVDEFIYWYYADLDRQECYAIAHMMVKALINEGKFNVSVEELFDCIEFLPLFTVDMDGVEGLEEAIEDEMDEFEQKEFEFKGQKYKIVL